MGFKGSLYKRYSLVFIVSVIFVSTTIIYFIQKILTEELREKGNLIASILSTVTADAVLTYDYVTLERYVNELVKNNNFVSIKILKSDGTVIAEAESELKTDHVYSLNFPVQIDNDRLGTVLLSYSREKIDNVLRNIVIGSILFVIIIHFLGLFINNKLIDHLVVKPLKKLIDATVEIKKGNYDIKIETGTKDEFKILADSMNSMVETVKETFDEIILNKNKLIAIIENIADGIFVTDLDERITEFNRSAELITGYKKDEVIGRYCEEVFKTKLCKDTCALRNKEVVIYNKETTFITKNGDERIAIVSSALIKDSNDHVIAAVQTFRDVTEEKKSIATFFHTEKMVAIGEMASAIAHEVNNPLSNIIGYSKLLMMNSDLDKDILQKLQIINEQSTKAASIVQSLLNFSRRGEGKTQLFDLTELIENVIRVTSIYTYDKHISIDFHTDGGDFVIRYDMVKMEQVIFNLLLNSIHAIELSGNISIELSHQDGNIFIKVADTGVGISENHLNNIFQPFFTTKPRGKGTGLGLFIVKTIVKDMGGEISVNSKLGEGATFTIRLPDLK